MLNFELLAQSGDHSIVKVCTVISDNPFGDTVPAYKVLLDEADNHILCNGGEGSCFDPLGKVINSHQDEVMSIGFRRLDLSNHVNAPHHKLPGSSHDIHRNWRYMHFVSIDLTFMIDS